VRTTSWVPVPESDADCGLPLALSVTDSDAVRAPVAEGLNNITMLQLAPAASELVQVLVSGKSPLLVPVIAIEAIVSVALPEFLRVTVFTGLVTPVATVPKFRLVGVRVTAGLLLELKVAVTDSAADMVTLQLPVPEQAPLQPANVDPAPAVSVRVTTVPLLKLALQVLGQLMPLGLLLTEPVPVPATETERVSTVAVVTVTVTMLEVELGYVPLPTNVAVTELAPSWSADPGTDSEQVPALNVQLPSAVDPAAKLALPVSAGGVST